MIVKVVFKHKDHIDSLPVLIDNTVKLRMTVMTEITHLIEENEYLKQKLSMLYQQNAALEARQKTTIQALKDCMDLVKQEIKKFELESI
jgi:predicted XRE-type DNA-binding protein